MRQSLDDIRNAYDLASEAYADAFLDELSHKPHDVELLQRFASTVGSAQRVLDLGCGPGHTTAHLHSLGLRPVGIDLSPAMVAKAAKLFPQVEFAVGDFLRLSQDDNSASGVLAFYCIVHLRPEQLEPAFGEMYRVLKPCGVLLLSFHVGVETVFVENFLAAGAALEFSMFPVVEVQAALTNAGFEDIEISERAPYDCEHPTTRCYVSGHKPPA